MAANAKDDVVGFLHNISPMKTSANGQKYFNLIVQTDKQEFHDTVCFTPENRESMAKMEEEKTPVRLRGVSKVPSYRGTGDYDIRCNQRTMIEKLTKEPTFKLRLPPNLEYTTIKELKSKQPLPEYVSLNAKVLDVDEGVERQTKSGPLKIFRCNIADSTDIVAMNYWETCLHRLSIGTTYSFSDLKVVTYDDEISVSLSNRCGCDVTEAIQTDITPPTKRPMESDTVTGVVSGVNIDLKFKCDECNATVEYNERDRFIKCGQCKMRQLGSSLNKSFSGSIKLKGHVTTYQLDSAAC